MWLCYFYHLKYIIAWTKVFELYVNLFRFFVGTSTYSEHQGDKNLETTKKTETKNTFFPYQEYNLLSFSIFSSIDKILFYQCLRLCSRLLIILVDCFDIGFEPYLILVFSCNSNHKILQNTFLSLRNHLVSQIFLLSS